MAQATPLTWSVDWDHLRPTQRFFMWFPIIGQQGNIYRDLLRQLKRRSVDDVAAWDGFADEEQSLALGICRILRDQLGWPTALFLPEDPADIPFWDYTGDLAGVEASMAVEEFAGATMPMEFWESLGTKTFGQVVREMSAARAEQAPCTGSPTCGSRRQTAGETRRSTRDE